MAKTLSVTDIFLPIFEFCIKFQIEQQQSYFVSKIFIWSQNIRTVKGVYKNSRRTVQMTVTILERVGSRGNYFTHNNLSRIHIEKCRTQMNNIVTPPPQFGKTKHSSHITYDVVCLMPICMTLDFVPNKIKIIGSISLLLHQVHSCHLL